MFSAELSTAYILHHKRENSKTEAATLKEVPEYFGCRP